MVHIPHALLPVGAGASALTVVLLAMVVATPRTTSSSSLVRRESERMSDNGLPFLVGPTNGSVSFKAQCPLGVFDQAITAVITVSKTGKKSLVNGAPGANEVDGRKEFPRSTQMSAVPAYYDTLLSSNGWVAGTDYVVSGNSIHFYGISQLDCGSNHKHLSVYASVDSGTATTVPVAKMLSVTRGSLLAGGTVYLSGFGYSTDAVTGLIATATTPVECTFSEGDTAAQLVAKVASVLSVNGWTYQSTSNTNEIVILRNGEDMPIQLLHFEVAYASKGLDKNDDHWVLQWVQ